MNLTLDLSGIDVNDSLNIVVFLNPLNIQSIDCHYRTFGSDSIMDQSHLKSLADEINQIQIFYLHVESNLFHKVYSKMNIKQYYTFQYTP